MDISIFNKIPKDKFLKSVQPTIVHRLGFFQGATYDLIELFAGIVYPPHYHKKAQGYLDFVIGEGIFILNGEEIPYQRGSSFFIPCKIKHGFKPKVQTLILSIQSPPTKEYKTGKEDLYF